MKKAFSHTAGRAAMWDGHVQVAWDATSLDAYMRCARYWYYSIHEGWRPKALSADLLFGKIVHECCAEYDRIRFEGVDHEPALRDAVRMVLNLARGGVPDSVTGEIMPALDDCGDNKKTTHTAVRLLVWWADEVAEDNPVETLRLADNTPALEHSFRFPLTITAPAGDNYIVCGHFDKLATFLEHVWVVERKTTKQTIGSYFWKQFSPNAQIDTYALAGRIVLPGPSIAGVLMEAFQTGVTMTRFERHMEHRSRAYLEEWFTQIEQWVKRAERDSLAEEWPKCPASCALYGGCDFRSICSKDPGTRERYLEANFQRLPWNPLRNR